MNKSYLIEIFLTLRKRIQELTPEDLTILSFQAQNENNWFTPENVQLALQGLVHYLEETTFRKWAESYPTPSHPRKIGVVMAGNIPMVGVHDLICVLVSGHFLQAKLSSSDSVLMKFLINSLLAIEPQLSHRIEIVEQLKGFDAVIATGSDNTARYFEYYFGKYPHVIRKNRTSVAILHGKESQEDLENLGKDIFTYYGLGCRNVTKIYIPENYDFNLFFESIESFKKVFEHHKYVNNYDYNKSIYLVNKINHLDNGFLLLVENSSLFSPISVLHYEKYVNLTNLVENLELHKEKIQCIVGDNKLLSNCIHFGEAQTPSITDYADGVDTMEFLSKI
ncbi:MAG: acyl-CoA reductase [Thermoflexibacter sp.]